MKRMVTSLTLWAKRTAGRELLAIIFSAFCITAAFGQNPSASQELGNLSGMSWKTNPDLNASLAAERSRMDVMLAAPGLPAADRSMFLAYQQLLDLVKADVQTGIGVDQALLKNYEKVLANAPNDPDLKELPINGLASLLPGLLEALTPVQVPAVSQY